MKLDKNKISTYISLLFMLAIIVLAPKSYILSFLAICFLILIHELGHFLVAKFFKMPVTAFAIGFGPSLFKWKKGETEYKINIFPLGGYVGIEGENSENVPNGFLNNKWYERLTVLFAGVLFNLITALVIFSLLFSFYGVPEKIVQLNDTVPNTGAAQYLLPKDQITKINNHLVTVENYTEIGKWIDESKGEPVSFSVKRNKEELNFNIPLTQKGDKQILGISYSPTMVFVKESFTLKTLIEKPIEETMNIGKLIFKSLAMMFNGEVKASDMEGPIGIVKVTNAVAQTSFAYLLYWVAILSLNLAIMNAMPIPALDGGQIMFLILEMILGKKYWNKKIAIVLNNVFLYALLGLMALVTFNDIYKIFSKI